MRSIAQLNIKIILSLISISAFAETDVVNGVFSETDSSLKFLSMVFGSINGLLPDSPVLLISIGIRYLNLGLITFISGLIAYTYTSTAIKTSNQGKFLGKQGGGITATFRSFTSVSILAPIPAYNGYSLLQIMIIKIVILGVGLANNVWHEVTKIVDQQGSILGTDIQETNINNDLYPNSKVTTNNTTISTNKFAYCIVANKLNYKSIITTPYSIEFSVDENSIKLNSKTECGTLKFTLTPNMKSSLTSSMRIISKPSLEKINFEPITNYVKHMISLNEMIFNQSDLTKLSQGSYYEYDQLNETILKQSYIAQLNKIGIDPKSTIAWFDSWIFAAANYTKLMGNSSKSEANNTIEIEAEITSNYQLPNDYQKLFIAPAVTDTTGIDNKTKVTKPDNDVYLNAIQSIMPQNLKLNNANWQEFLTVLKAQEANENRSEKTFKDAASGGAVSGDNFWDAIYNTLKTMTSMVTDNWDLGMLNNTFDLESGPYNLTARDTVLTRDIQLFMMQLYQAWKRYVQPSNVRSELSPLIRLRAFGLVSTNIGIEFIANIVQDTFFAAIGAQMEAQRASFGYLAKSFIMNQVTNGIFIAANTFLSSFFLSFLHPLMIVGAAASQGLSAYYTMMMAVPQLLTPLVVASKVMYVMLAVAASLPIILLGLLFAVYVVFIPFLVFLFSVIGWVMTVIEAVLAAPIVASGMANPQGHDFLGKSQQLIMLLAAVFVRPICIIIGFIMAIFLFNSAINLLDFAYFPFVDSYVGTTDNMGMGLAVILLMYAYGYLVFCLVRFCFSLTFVLPNYIVRWIGMMPVSGGEEEAMESIESSMKEAYSSGLSGSYGGVGMMKR